VGKEKNYMEHPLGLNAGEDKEPLLIKPCEVEEVGQ
jgi:hypothetical protein